VKLVEIDRKSPVLSRTRFGCLQEVFTLNITRGCEFACVYCYARGYPDAPPLGEVHLFRNLPEKLTRELDSPRRRNPVLWVAFNTASDSFQMHPRIQDVTYRAMEALLHRGIGLSFLTKGYVPDRFLRLFSQRPELVKARIGLVSLEDSYRDLFEPKAASAKQRLDTLERLRATGVEVEVRVDPIIPFYTDRPEEIRQLLETLALKGVRSITLSYLHLRPAVLEQLRRELPPKEFRLLESCFAAQPWTEVGTSTRSKLVPRPLRQRGYRRFQEIAQEFGLRVRICACKNPDMEAHRCSIGLESRLAPPTRRWKQLSLFPC
jgi:DNA repair photolyase